MADFYKYADNPTVFRSSDNYAFTSEQDFLSKGGNWNKIETRTAQAPASFYKTPDSPTVYNAQTNQAYSTPEQFFQAGGARDFSNVAVRQVDLKLDPTTTTNTNVLSQPPVTNNDIQSQLAELQKRQQAYLMASQQISPEQQAAQQTYNQYQTQADQLNVDAANVNLRAQAGLNQISDKVIPLEYQQGQKASLSRLANQQLQSLGVQGQALGVQMGAAARNLQSLEAARTNTLTALEQAVGFGQDNIALQLQLDTIKKNEQNAALQTATELGVTKPYFLIGNTVYDTGSGNPFTSEEDFKTRTGMTVGEAGNRNLIQNPILDQQQAIVTQQAFENSLALAREGRLGTGSGGGGAGNPATLDYWVNLLATGQVGIQNVPLNIRDSVVQRLGESGNTIIGGTAGKAKDAIAVFQTGNAQLDAIEKMAKKSITATSPGAAILQRVTGNIGALTKTNSDAALFRDTINAFTSTLSRAAGEVGVLTDQDVSRIRNALPTFGDTTDIATAKIATLRNLFNARMQGALKAYTSPIGGTSNNDINDPLGIR